MSRDIEKDKAQLKQYWEMDYIEDGDDIGEILTISDHWISQYEAMREEKEKWRKEAFKNHPTQDAYDAACAALQKHRERVRELEEKLQLHNRPDVRTRMTHGEMLSNAFKALEAHRNATR